MNLLRELLAAIDDRRPVVLATVVDTSRSVPRRAGSKMLVYGDGSIAGSIGGGEMEARVIAEALAALDDARPRRLTYSLLDPATGDPGVCGGEVELYLEPNMPPTTIFVIGLGHVGRAVVELAAWLGYQVAAWDDRVAVAEGDTWTPPAGVTILTGDRIEEALEAHPLDAFTRVVMVTRNVDLDTAVLPAVLATDVATVGLMGSGRRWQTTRTKLLDGGLAETALSRIVTPIGVEIAAETPAEIAVSILAQVIGQERSA
ncbi:MAG: XdhC family protein [Actinomycetota bacterium]